MSKIIVFLIYSWLWLISLLPLGLLHVFSEVIYFMVFYVFPYRKKMTFKNIRNSFPELSETEVTKIAKTSYRHFSHKIVEIIKTIHLSEKQMKKRFVYTNPEIFDEYFKNKQSVIIVSGHQANWDWGGTAKIHLKHDFIPLYKPSKSIYFDIIINRIRSKFGAFMVPNTNILRYISSHKNVPSCYWFIADQRPMRKDIQYWTTMLNQDTPVFLGSEKIAVKMNFPVFYFKINVVKKGYYEATFVPVEENPKSSKEFEITEKHTRLLEQHILEQPAFYTWTHNKWKHKKNI